ncbi:MAG TPA: ROK family protein [Solirubrobacteraceae bacterium]
MAGAQRITLGVDLGGTKIQTVALRGLQTLASARVPTPQSGVADDVIEAILGTIHTTLAQVGCDASAVEGVGIGSPGEIDIAAGVVTQAANVPGFSASVRLGPLVSEALGGMKVRIDNDVRVGVLGEHRVGAGRPYANMLGVWLGTGVGGGLILDGELHDGRGAAGEIGHVVVKPNGRKCGCGRRGCLEAYAGRARMERRARKLVKRGQDTVLFEIMREESKERLTSGIYVKALKHGDELTKQLLADAAWALALALASAQNLLDLDAIVLGGGMGDKLGQAFVDQVVKQMAPHLFADDHPPVVLHTELGDLSGAVGAALLAAEPM